jgi:hypothetical protein
VRASGRAGDAEVGLAAWVAGMIDIPTLVDQDVAQRDVEIAHCAQHHVSVKTPAAIQITIINATPINAIPMSALIGRMPSSK